MPPEDVPGATTKGFVVVVEMVLLGVWPPVVDEVLLVVWPPLLLDWPEFELVGNESFVVVWAVTDAIVAAVFTIRSFTPVTVLPAVSVTSAVTT